MNQEQLTMMTDVREMWLFVRRNVGLVVFITLGFAVLAIVLALTLPSRYIGETIIMLDPRHTNVTDIQSVLSGLPADNSVVRSEVDILKSRAVSDRVIDDLDLMKSDDFNPNLTGTAWLMRLISRNRPEDKERQQSEDRSAVAAALLKNLTVENDGRSYSIDIQYRDHDPVRAAKIANAFADQYLNDQLEVKYEVTKRANDWLSKRMDELREKVNAGEKAVEDYKAAHNLVSVGDETLVQRQMEDLDGQLVEARADLSQAEARLNSVKRLHGAELESSSLVIASPLIQQLKSQEAEVNRKVADLSTRYGDRHPMMIDARNEQRSIHDKIYEEVQKIIAGNQNDYDVSKAKVDSLAEQLSKLKDEAGLGNQATVMLRQMEREAAANRSLYEGFLNRFKQIAEQQDMQIADSRIIARAEPTNKPYFPNIFIFLGVGISMGLVVGVMISLVLEYLDRGLRSLSMAEKLYGVPGLGFVPIADTAKDQLVSDYVLQKPMSVYSESIRSVRAAIHFSNVDNPPKTIAITSSFPGEGKTIFSISLSRLMAKAGHKVILLDGDMRRPRLCGTLGLDKNKPDLASVLAGKAPLASAIQRDVSGCDVIMSRAKTANPQDLLNSHKMEELLATLREQYELVIIDTPPIMAVADSALIGQKVDTTVYIARWSSTPREVVGEGLKQLQKFNVKLAGLVLSQVDLQDRKQYGFDDYATYYGQYKSYYTN